MRIVARADRRLWILVALLSAIYLVINLALPLVSGGTFLKTYVIQPVLWGLALLTVIRLGPYRPAAKSGLRTLIIQLALAIGFLQVFMYVIGGLFSGFGRSPSAFTFKGIATNLVYAGGMLAGQEFARAWLMNHSGRRTFITLVLVTLFFTVLATPLGQLTSLRANVPSVNYIDSALLPALAASLLASYLAMMAGPFASLAYLGIVQAFWWLSPVLPDLSWALKGIIGTGVPIIALVMVRSYYLSKTEHRRARLGSEGSLAGWVVMAVVSVALIWFAVGIFPIRPSLVASGSMTPVLAVGDIAIVVKTPTDAIKVGDIIDYKKEKGVDIVHRVIGIQQKGNAKVFITKGDANNAADSDPVLPDNIIGKVVFNIPKVGWLAIVLKGFFT